MDNMMQSGPAGQMMGKKVGGKWTIGQYISYQKKYFMWLLIATVVVGALTLIPAVSGIFGVIAWLVSLGAAFVFFWFGYQMAKEKKGEMKEALIGGAILGLIYGVITGIFKMLFYFIVWRSIFTGFGVFGVGIGPSATSLAIMGLIWSIVLSAVGGLVMSIIGFAVAGGFNKSAARQM